MDNKNIIQDKINMITSDIFYNIDVYQDNGGEYFSPDGFYDFYGRPMDRSQIREFIELAINNILWDTVKNCDKWDNTIIYDGYLGDYIKENCEDIACDNLHQYNGVHVLVEHSTSRLFITLEDCHKTKIEIEIYEAHLIDGYDQDNLHCYPQTYSVELSGHFKVDGKIVIE